MADHPTTAPGAQAERWKPSHNPWLIATAVMAATFMEILDTSVANVSLPHIAGNLSATTEESTWVLTSYLVSNAIVLPMTGWLGLRFGRKRLLTVCIGLFTLASVLCGMAPNLGFLILARIFQGIGGGALVPISQAVLLESFPPEKRGVAMATFGMGVIVAPILGWSDADCAREVATYLARVEAEVLSQTQPDDASADALRAAAPEARAEILEPVPLN